MVPFESLGAVSYSPSIVTMAQSCISSETKPDMVENRNFFHTLLTFDAPVMGVPVGIFSYYLVWKKLEWWGYPMVKKWYKIEL